MKESNSELIEAIKRMEAADEWSIVLLLLELLQYRCQASIKSEAEAVKKEIAAA